MKSLPSLGKPCSTPQAGLPNTTHPTLSATAVRPCGNCLPYKTKLCKGLTHLCIQQTLDDVCVEVNVPTAVKTQFLHLQNRDCSKSFLRGSGAGRIRCRSNQESGRLFIRDCAGLHTSPLADSLGVGIIKAQFQGGRHSPFTLCPAQGRQSQRWRDWPRSPGLPGDTSLQRGPPALAAPMSLPHPREAYRTSPGIWGAAGQPSGHRGRTGSSDSSYNHT